MLHLRLKAYLQAFMFGKEKVHGDVTILCSSSSPSSDISMYRCDFFFCLDFSILLNSEFYLVCLMESLVALIFNVVITISSFLFSSSPCCLFFMDFPLCTEQNIYRNIPLFEFHEITLPMCGHSSKMEFKQGCYVRFTSALRAVQN
jgi:hypothetical protein